MKKEDKPKKRRPLDAWSVGHFVGGAALGAVGLNWWWGPVLVVAYELLEMGLRRLPFGRKGIFERESWANIGGDVVVGLAGFFLTWWLLPDPSWGRHLP